MRRAEALWDEWDAAIQRGEPAVHLMARLSDDGIVALLASGNPTRRRYELDILRAEMLNRLKRLRDALSDITDAAERHVAEMVRAAEEAAQSAAASERALLEHIEARQDAIGGEPEAVARTRAAAESAEEAARRAAAATERLARLRRETMERAGRAP